MPSSDVIPTPLRTRWREFRVAYLPLLIVAAGILGITHLWREHVLLPGHASAQPVPERRVVLTPNSGVITNLFVSEFQRVEKDQVLAEIIRRVPDRRAESLSPVKLLLLRAPISGVVTAVHRHAGEDVAAGSRVVTISSENAIPTNI